MTKQIGVSTAVSADEKNDNYMKSVCTQRRLHVMVIGLAESGLAVGQLLHSHGCVVYYSEIKSEDQIKTLELEKAKAFAKAIYTGGHNFSNFANINFVVLSPGVMRNSAIVASCIKSGMPVIGEIEYAFQHIRGDIIGVSGTKGKTTVIRMLEHLFEISGLDFDTGGHIDKPLSAINKSIDFILSELACYQIEFIDRFRPYVYILTNIAHDHKSRYPDFKDYFHLKTLLLKKQNKDDYAILPITLRPWVNSHDIRSTVYYFSMFKEEQGDIFYDQGTGKIILPTMPDTVFDIKNFSLIGEGNICNLMATVLTGKIVGISEIYLQKLIEDFEPLKHRAQIISKKNDKVYIDDSCSNHKMAIQMVSESDNIPVALFTFANPSELNGIKNIDRVYEMDPQDVISSIKTGLDEIERDTFQGKILYSPAIPQTIENGLEQQQDVFRGLVKHYI